MGGLATDVLAKIGDALGERAPEYFANGGKVQQWLESGTRTIERLGPAAQEAWAKLKTGQEAFVREAAPLHKQITDTLSKLDQAGVEDLKDQLATDKIRTPEAMITKQMMSDEFDKHVADGRVKASRKLTGGYDPRMPVPDAFKGRSKDDAIKHLVATGQARNAAEADSLLKVITGGGQKFKNIEAKRTANLPDSFWRRDKGVYADYIVGSVKRRVEAAHFGEEDQALTDALSKVKEEGGEQAYTYTRWLMEHELGRSIGRQGPVEGLARDSVERGTASLEALTKLSFAGVRHLGQAANIPLVVGEISPMIRGLASYMANSGAAEEHAMKSGVLFREAMMKARNEAMGRWTLGGKMLEATFQPIRRFNRILASEAGRIAAQDTFAKLAKDQGNAQAKHLMDIMGVDFQEALNRGGLTEEDLQKASKRVADFSMFELNPSSVPPAWRNSPWGRTVTMYKTYGAMQAKLIKDFVVKPALGIGGPQNIKPLIYMSILFPTMGEVTNDISELLRKGNLKDRPDWNKAPYDRILEDAAYVGSFGLMYDAARSMSYNSTTAFWSFLGGPVISDVVDVSHEFYKTFDGSKPHPLDSLTESAKERLTRSIPVVGQRLYQEYFAKKHAKTQSMFQEGKVTKLVHKAEKKLSE